MRFAQVAVLSLAVLAVGSTVAQELKTIEVRAEESKHTIVMACVNPETPSLKQVEEVLSITDPAQSKGLREKLMAAAAEACAQKQPKILVSRGANGGLTWKPMS